MSKSIHGYPNFFLGDRDTSNNYWEMLANITIKTENFYRTLKLQKCNNSVLLGSIF